MMNNIQKVEPQFNDTIRKLAKKQHMNTDVRRLIFGTLLTSEVCQHYSYLFSKIDIDCNPRIKSFYSSPQPSGTKREKQ